MDGEEGVEGGYLMGGVAETDIVGVLVREKVHKGFNVV